MRKIVYDPTNLVDPNTEDFALRDLALSRLKAKIQEESASMNVVTPIVENVLELRSMLKFLYASAFKLILSLLLIKRTKGKSAAKFASEAWLTWSFGISPTLNDIENLTNAIDGLLNDHGRSFRMHGAARKQWRGGRTSTTTGAFGGDYVEQIDGLYTLSYRYVAGVNFNVNSANNYGIGSQLGVEWSVLIPTLWELMAFSWLFDYFSTVGAYFDDVFMSSAETTKYVVLNKRYSFDAQIIPGYKPQSGFIAPPGVYVDKKKPGRFEYSFFSRTPIGSLPTRSLRFKTIDEVGKNWDNKVRNLLSVLILQRGGSPNPFARGRGR